MSSLPVVITQDEVIDLTIEDRDNENMDKSLDTKDTTAHKGEEKLYLQESTLRKSLFRKTFITSSKSKSLYLRKSLVSTKEKKPNKT